MWPLIHYDLEVDTLNMRNYIEKSNFLKEREIYFLYMKYSLKD